MAPPPRDPTHPNSRRSYPLPGDDDESDWRTSCHRTDSQPTTPATPGAVYLDLPALPTRQDSYANYPRFSALTTPVPDLALSSPSPPLSAISFTSALLPFEERNMSSPLDMPESPSSGWPGHPHHYHLPTPPPTATARKPSASEPQLAPRPHFDSSSNSNSISGTWSGEDSSLIDPRLPTSPPPPPLPSEPQQRDSTQYSLSQYSVSTGDMTDLISRFEGGGGGPFSSTPPPRPQSAVEERSRPSTTPSFDIHGRPLPSAPPAPSGDPRFAFPPLDFAPRGAAVSGYWDTSVVMKDLASSASLSITRPRKSSAILTDSAASSPILREGFLDVGSSTDSYSKHHHHHHHHHHHNNSNGNSGKFRPTSLAIPPPAASHLSALARPRTRSTMIDDGQGVIMSVSDLADDGLIGNVEVKTASIHDQPRVRSHLVSLSDVSLSSFQLSSNQTRRQSGVVLLPPSPFLLAPVPTSAGITNPPPPPSGHSSTFDHRPQFATAPPLTPPESSHHGSISTPSVTSPRSHNKPPRRPPSSKPPPLPSALPRVPAFTAVFVNPQTDKVSVSSKTSTPRSSPVPSPCVITPPPPPPPPSTSAGSSYKVSEWLGGRKPSSSLALVTSEGARDDASVPIRELVDRASRVERKLCDAVALPAAGGSGESITTTKAMKVRRSSRSSSVVSRFSLGWLSRGGRGGGGGEGSSVDLPRGGGSWSKVEDCDDDDDEEEKMRRRRRRRETRSKKKIIDGRRKTQDWLQSLPPPKKEAPLWKRTLGGSSHPSSKPLLSSRRFRVLLLLAVLCAIAIIVGTVVGVKASQKGSSTDGDCTCENGGIARQSGSSCSCTCSGDWGGAFCELDGTCIDTGQGFKLAKSLSAIADAANSVSFQQEPINATRLGLVMNDYLAPSTKNTKSCKNQLSLVAVPNLSPQSFPNRLAWMQQAVLWTLALSESDSSGLLAFIKSKSFSGLDDEPGSPNSNFQFIAAGYIFDLSAMSFSAPSVAWLSAAAPSADQLALVSTTSENALDRLTSSAVATSTLRTTALWHRWAEANLSMTDLATFRQAIQSAYVVVPFDAGASYGSVAAMTLANAQTANSSFPPSIGCLPSLTALEAQQVNSVEVNAFGLSAVNVSSALDRVCLDRPLYGVLDLLKFRTPFLPSDPRSSLPQQGLVVSADDKPRMTIHAGELLAGGTAGPSSAASAPSSLFHFGTFNNLDHVILDFIDLLSPDLAQEYVSFVVNGSSTPPTSSSALAIAAGGNLASIPIFEVQLWGGLRFFNTDRVVSSLSTAALSSALFFGTSTGQTFRTWAINGPTATPLGGGILLWTLDAFQGQVVVDNNLTSTSFNSLWSSAAKTASPDTVWSSLLAAGGITLAS
ncbi:hypothetical protein T439DRAFT_326940 [Meredithblackwellia eburnea MCA 4105]